jgi:thymidylate synthase (FAD)
VEIGVLDHGYVRLLEHIGSDLSVINCARMSHGRESEELGPSDVRLIKFLAENGHTSPFRHQFISFRVKAPLFVARQWWRHSVGSAHLESGNSWNELSRRYSDVGIESGEFYYDIERVDLEAQELIRGSMLCSLSVYLSLVEKGVPKEIARLVLPAYALYTEWVWTANLQAVCHFVEQRLADGAQHEIKEYAKVVLEIVKQLFPVSVSYLVKGGQSAD